MAEEHETTEEQSGSAGREQEAPRGENGSDGSARKTAIRAAAVAAASGATALAAKKAFSGRGDSESREEGRGTKRGNDSLITNMLASGWDAAKDSLIPVAEDVAKSAGKYVAEHGPDVLRDTLVPRFIAGFEQARRPAKADAA